ncbi:MAG: hypothetical protein QOG62_2737, partial [Thermoleophilaceae bacterium]|nr:hypothetical protein [Thermoleophilaceae bacterium]
IAGLALAGCDPAYQIYVVNERAHWVLVVVEYEDAGSQRTSYKVPEHSEGLTISGIGYLTGRVLVFDPVACDVLGQTAVMDLSRVTVRVPASGQAVLEESISHPDVVEIPVYSGGGGCFLPVSN